MIRLCSAPRCSRPAHAKGLCSRCYDRQRGRTRARPTTWMDGELWITPAPLPLGPITADLGRELALELAAERA